jgi:hypothetical protein
MAAPTYVAKKVGDHYLVVPKNPMATTDGSMWIVGGSLVTGLGLLRGGVCGAAVAVLGASAICRGVTGKNPWKMLLNDLCPTCFDSERRNESPSFQNDVIPSSQKPQDEVEEMSMQSFPASDAPARTAST